jgi:hypothetical protein
MIKNKKLLSITSVSLFLLFLIPTISAQVPEWYGGDAVQEKSVPEWIKNSVAFWVNGQVSDAEFLNTVEFLVSENIIQTSVPKANAESQIYTVTTSYDIWGISSSANGMSKTLRCTGNDIAISGGFDTPYFGIYPAMIKPIGVHEYAFSLVNVASNESVGSATLYVTCMKVG